MEGGAAAGVFESGGRQLWNGGSGFTFHTLSALALSLAARPTREGARWLVRGHRDSVLCAWPMHRAPYSTTLELLFHLLECCFPVADLSAAIAPWTDE